MENHHKKKCQKCGSHDVIRKGVKRGSSYWYCKSCQCYFSGREKPNKAAIVEFYLQGRHTLLETAQKIWYFSFYPYNDISKTYPKIRMFLAEFIPLL